MLKKSYPVNQRILSVLEKAYNVKSKDEKKTLEKKVKKKISSIVSKQPEPIEPENTKQQNVKTHSDTQQYIEKKSDKISNISFYNFSSREITYIIVITFVVLILFILLSIVNYRTQKILCMLKKHKK